MSTVMNESWQICNNRSMQQIDYKICDVNNKSMQPQTAGEMKNYEGRNAC